MGRMPFHNNRIAGGECRSRIAAGDRKSQREVAGAENHHRPNWDQHPAHVRFWQWFTLGLRKIYCRLNPRSFPDHIRKHAKLSNRSSAFTSESFRRQASFRRNSGYQIITKRHDLVRDALEKLRNFFCWFVTIDLERAVGELESLLDVGFVCFVIWRLKRLAQRRVIRAKRFAFAVG